MTKIPEIYNKTVNILIVEDEILLAMGMKCSLLDFGYEVSGIETTAVNAIKHVKDNHPDLVLMDVQLKGTQTGIDAGKYIWQYYKIPIIFISSYNDDKTIKEAMNCEPYAYLLKPCRDDALKVTIETTLHKHNYFFKNKDCLKSKKEINNIFNFEDELSYDKAKRVLFKKDLALKLTGNEIKLFEVLSDYPGEPVNFERISNYIWRDDESDISKLRVLISRLKIKIGTNLIENVFELGYKLKIEK